MKTKGLEIHRFIIGHVELITGDKTLKRRKGFSIGSKCECMCHTKGNIQDFCGYCASSHTNRISKRAVSIATHQ